MGMNMMGCLLRHLTGHHIIHIHLVMVGRTIELLEMEVFFHTHLRSLVVDPEVERSAIGVEEGTDLTENLPGLIEEVRTHGVFRIDDRSLELHQITLLSVVFLVTDILATELQDTADLFQNFLGLRNQPGLLHRVM